MSGAFFMELNFVSGFGSSMITQAIQMFILSYSINIHNKLLVHFTRGVCIIEIMKTLSHYLLTECSFIFNIEHSIDNLLAVT